MPPPTDRLGTTVVARMRSDVAEVLDEGTTLLVLQVGNKPALLGLRKLIRSPAEYAGRSQLHHRPLRVRDPTRMAATCGEWGSVAGELGRWRAGGDRGCPLRSGRSWPRCGPSVAPQEAI